MSKLRSQNNVKFSVLRNLYSAKPETQLMSKLESQQKSFIIKIDNFILHFPNSWLFVVWSQIKKKPKSWTPTKHWTKLSKKWKISHCFKIFVEPTRTKMAATSSKGKTLPIIWGQAIQRISKLVTITGGHLWEINIKLFLEIVDLKASFSTFLRRNISFFYHSDV